MSSHPRQVAQQDWIDFFARLPFSHAVTLKPNYLNINVSAEKLRSAFITFHRDIDRQILGPRFNQAQHSENRALAVGVIEGLPDSGHIHALFGIQRRNWERFEALFRPYQNSTEINPIKSNPWAHRVPSGTTDCQRLSKIEGWAGYSCKGLSAPDASDRIIFLPT